MPHRRPRKPRPLRQARRLRPRPIRTPRPHLRRRWTATFRKFDPIPNDKTDTNNHGPFSTDNIGRNYDYPEGSYARRREIIREHETYQQGWLYFIANDPRVPADVRKEMSRWGPRQG